MRKIKHLLMQWVLMIIGVLLIIQPISAQTIVGQELASREFFNPLADNVTTDFVHKLNASGMLGMGTAALTVPVGDGASYIRQTFVSIETGPIATPLTASFTADVRLINDGPVGSTDVLSTLTLVFQLLERGTFDFADPDSISGLGDAVGFASELIPPTPPYAGTGFQDFSISGDETDFVLEANTSYVGVVEFLFAGGATDLDAQEDDPTVTVVADPGSGFDGVLLNLDNATIIPEPAATFFLAAGMLFTLRRQRSQW